MKGRTTRTSIVLFCLAGLVALSVYAVSYGPSFGVYYHDCMRSPERFAGRETMLATVPVLSVGDGFFTVASKVGPAVVVGELPGIALGQYMDVRGEFRADGSVLLREAHVYHERKFKVYGSLAALILVVAVFGKAFWPLGRCRRGNA